MSIYRPKGRDVFVMDFIFKGYRVYETTGETNCKKAQKVYDRRLNDLREGATGLRPKKRQYFLGAAAEEWRHQRRKKPWPPSTLSIIDNALKRLLPAFGEDRLLADIEADDIARYQQARFAEPKRPSNRTINIEIGVLRKILIATGHWSRLRDEVTMLEEREDAGRALTPEQENLLLEECSKSASRALLPFVTLAIDTGARYDTIRTLQWGRVDLEGRRIQIGKDKTRAGSGRMVPLNTRAQQTLKFWAANFPDRKPEHYVFPVERYGLHGRRGSFGGVVKPYEIDPTRPIGSLKTAWESAKRRTQRHCPQCRTGTLVDGELGRFACESCGVALEQLPEGLIRFRLHDCRHSSVSRMIAAGQPLPIIAKVVGWKLSPVVEMAERYGHFEESALRSAVESIRTPLPYKSTYAEESRAEVVQ